MKDKVNGCEAFDSLAMLERLFSMLCMLCMDKGSPLNLGLMISSNYAVIMIALC